jgi:hypothetical protein
MRNKMFLTVLSLLITMLLLTSCIIIPLYKVYNFDNETVSSIDIYDLRGDENCYSGFWEEKSPVYTVDENNKENFLSDLSHISFSDTLVITIAAIDPGFSYGDWVAKINFENGSYTFISYGGYGETFDENGEIIDSNHFSCDYDKWEEFISKYVPEEIFEITEQPETENQTVQSEQTN